MAFFRSEPMKLCQIILHPESAFNCLIELGYVGKVQFRNIYDAQTAANNQYRSEIQRCNELKRIMSHLKNEIEDFNIKTVIYPDVDKDEIPEADDLKTIETTLQSVYEELTAVEANIEGLRKQRNFLIERLQVIKQADLFLTGSHGLEAVMAMSNSVVIQLMKDEMGSETTPGNHLSFFTGTIPLERFNSFETTLWRVTRGNFYLKHMEIAFREDDIGRKTSQTVKKFVFMVFFVGAVVKRNISKLCQGFGVKLFDCPESVIDRQSTSSDMRQDLHDIDVILEQTQKHRFRILLIAAADLFIWRVKINKMLMTYYVLNHMKRVRHLHEGKYLQAECWIPSKEIPVVRTALIVGARRTSKGNPLSMFIPMLNILHKRGIKNFDKPTYFALNRFTKAFQNLIDAYGIAQYQELNPAPYTIITFPFLFAVMFGDMGHGLIMLVFGLWMLLKEKSLIEKNRFATEQSEIWTILFGGRYIITLMGGFSIYTGLIYNDCFSKSFNIFGSSWRISLNKSTVFEAQAIQLDPRKPDHYQGTPYILGMDPVWDASGENAIITFNSLKMKLAVILGVMQMIFGLVLSAFNYIHRREYVDLFLVFVPQITFLLCIFFYLVILIFYKWVNYGGHIDTPYNSACAPSILIIFINMLLMKGADEPPMGCDKWMFEFQNVIQTILLAAALLCIPILMAGKPLFFMYQEKKNLKIKNAELRKSRHTSTMFSMRKSLIYCVESSVHQEEVEHTDLGELWIHSGIHCIESILGAVSHTASYLRLWALSLAHDQLSTVLWNMVLKVGLSSNRGYLNSLVLYVVFIFWATLTVSILVVMEGLSAFLHTLRLHWVEFQSKFYAGSGEVFTPFYFKQTSINDID